MTQRRSNWERLQSLWVVGAALSESEQLERLEGAQAPEQRGELEFYDRAQRWTLEQSPEQAEDDARFLEQALKRVKGGRNAALRLVRDPSPASAQTPRRPQRAEPRHMHTVAWLLTGAVATAAVALLWLRSTTTASSTSGSKRPLTHATELARCRLASFSGTVEFPEPQTGVVGASFAEGETLSTGAGTACLTIDDSARVCLPNDSALTLTSLNPRDIRLHVRRGSGIASLSPRQAGSFFSLTAGEVVATAHGTIYALELAPKPAGVRVIVLEGVVEVKGAHELALVTADTAAHLETTTGKWSHLTIEPQERDRWLSWLQPPAPAAAVDALPPGSAAPALAPSSLASERSEAGVRQGREALFAAARKQAGLGHASVARGLYRELLMRYPGPGTASVQVVLGNLEMELGAPERALTAFDGYLRSGGPLEPEALHGKVRALRALGRKTEEAAAIRGYLSRYPSGFQAPALNKRLQELE